MEGTFEGIIKDVESAEFDTQYGPQKRTNARLYESADKDARSLIIETTDPEQGKALAAAAATGKVVRVVGRPWSFKWEKNGEWKSAAKLIAVKVVG